ncbi:hypothetical protein [Sabulibacter ruber]|uniref:hypothetical protein n=1 Tax=Sabulibacter ruber TaxID=2811901 RepID=UPI001A9640A0|nr:hypothetical protein [Sabulibacter ruber]
MRLLFIFLFGLFLAGSALVGYFFFERCALPYNSEGRYFDGTVVYHRQSVEVLGLGFAGCGLVTALLFRRLRLSAKSNKLT